MFKQLLKQITKGGIYQAIPADNILERQRYTLFSVFTFLGTLLLLAFTIEEYSISSLDQAKTILFLAIASTLIINYVGLQFHRMPAVAYSISIVAGLSLIHCATYYSGGVKNPDFFYMGSIILYSYIVLENKGGRVTLWLSVANIIYFYALTDFTEPGIYISQQLNDRAIDGKHLYTAITSMFLMTSLSTYLAYSKNAVIRRIEDSKAVLEKKNEELQELSLVASETVNSVIITDKTGKVEWVNDGFTRLTGYSSEEITGQPNCDMLFGNKSDKLIRQQLADLNFEGNNFNAEIIKYRKNGEMIWVQENVTRIIDETDQLTKYIFIESDISERKKSEEKMAEYLKNLEKTNKELDKFAYVVSHDLKAPLRAIGNLTGWIEEDAGHLLPGEVRKNFNLIKERVGRMENLINGILDYSKAAKRNDQFELFDTGTIVKEAVEFLGHKSEVNFQVQDKLPMVLADKVKVQQVFMNLIGNAIKFNTKADKQVKISFTESGPFYQFSIKDNGPGIDPRFHDKIFVIFQTVNTRDEFESTGVGLAIVKKIIEEQGGRIWVESHAGNGATFHFTWPKYHENAQLKNEQYAKAI